MGGQSISLPTLVIVSAPPEIPHPSPPSHQEKSLSLASSSIAPSEPQPVAQPKSPASDQGVPVLATQLPPPSKAEPAKIASPTHPSTSHTAVADATPTHAKPVTSTPPSSYNPGTSLLPHPPYPPEARDRRQTGTVTMSVQFDAEGSVAQARVVESSGVPILDSCTRTFIRDHWHSLAYAGQTVSVPVQYTLENL